jgi:hypothetical protein
MESTTSSAVISKPARWVGYVLSALAVLFMLFDGVVKFVPVAYTQSFEGLGFPLDLATFVGILEIVCLIIYAIPRTSFLGAILLTGYLGGAVVLQVRVGAPAFNIIFPLLLGLLLWGGLLLRDARLRALFFQKG